VVVHSDQMVEILRTRL